MATTTRQASIDRAMAKARQIAAQGGSPRFIGWAAGAGRLFKVASATHADHEYTVSARRVAAGVATECECEAASRGLVCYHRALVQLDLAGSLAPVAAMAAD
jgi:hypothetical protein